MSDPTRAAIADPHWDACETCARYGENGCVLSRPEMSVYLGDWIICDDYMEKAD